MLKTYVFECDCVHVCMLMYVNGCQWGLRLSQ